jgi:hypothetical protein
MTTVLEAINSAFEALFYGSGSWLGLLLFLSIMMGLLLKWKYTGTLLLPISLFLGIEYSNKNLGWHAIIMFISAIFTVLYMLKELRR